MIIYATKHIEGLVKAAIVAEANDTHLELTPLAVLPDELCLKQRLILIGQDTSRLLQDFAYTNTIRSTLGVIAICQCETYGHVHPGIATECIGSASSPSDVL